MLSVDEFTAIRSVGFEPIGQVLGVSVHQGGYPYGIRCGAYPGMPAYGPIKAIPSVPSFLRVARDMALARMVEECVALGGQGIVDVTVELKPFVSGAIEFSVVGSAVRAIGPLPRPTYSKPLPVPFTADLTGRDFALLVRNGWMPTRMVFGLANRIRHTTSALQFRWGWANTELTHLSTLIHRTRVDARDDLADEARKAGGLHVVVRDMSLRQWEQECPGSSGGRDYLCQFTIWGTAVTPVRSTRPSPGNGVLPILRLSQKGRP